MMTYLFSNVRIWLILPVLSLLLLLFVAGVVSSQEDTTQVLFDEAMAHFDAGNFEDAIVIFNQMLEEAVLNEPDRARVISWRGWTYYWLDEYDRAVEDLSEALVIDPDYPNPHNGLGWVYYNTGESALAEREFRRALAMDPDYADAYHGLARLALDRGDVEEALEHMHASVDAAPTSPAPRRRLGVMYLLIGDYEQALQTFPTRAELPADLGFNWYYRGIAKIGLRDYAGALADLERSADASSELLRPLSLFWSAVAYQQSGDEEAAARALDAARASAVSATDPSLRLGIETLAALVEGNMEAAEQALQGRLELQAKRSEWLPYQAYFAILDDLYPNAGYADIWKSLDEQLRTSSLTSAS